MGWGSKLVKSNNGCLCSFLGFDFPISGDRNVSLPPSTEKVPFTWKIYFLLPGDKGGSEYSSCIGSLLSDFYLKYLIDQNGTFGGSLPLVPTLAEENHRRPLVYASSSQDVGHNIGD